MNFGIIVNNLLIIFLMIAVGFAVGKAGLLSEKASGDFTSFLMKVTLPCMIFSSMIREYDAALIRDSVIGIVLCFVMLSLITVLCWHLSARLGMKESQRGTWMLSTTFGNSGFMGFPLALAIFGQDGLMLAAEQGLYAMSVPSWEWISSVEYGPFPQDVSRVTAFAKALKQTGKLTERPLADGLYVSRFARILPTYSMEKKKGADRILGSWLSGGMAITLTDTARMHKFVPFLSESARAELLQMFGLQPEDETEGTALRMPEPFEPEAKTPSGTAKAGKEEDASFGRRPRKEGPFILTGQPVLERFFREQLLDVIDREEEYRKFGVGFPGATLLHGPSGSGKTFAVERFAEYLGWPVFRITSGTVGSKYVHETSRKISEMFDLAIREAPSVLIIDELEAFVSSRESARGSAEIHMEEVDEFLRRIPDASENHVLLFGMTNLKDTIDEAVLRKGRFDYIMEVGMPSRQEVQAVLEARLKELPAEENLPLSSLARRLEGRPFSDVTFVLSEAGRMCVLRGKKKIDREALEEAFASLQPTGKKKQRIGF